MRQLSFEQLDQAFAELLQKALILASEAEEVCDEFDGHKSVQRLREALESFLEGSFEIPYSEIPAAAGITGLVSPSNEREKT